LVRDPAGLPAPVGDASGDSHQPEQLQKRINKINTKRAAGGQGYIDH
jgi:hypothetical protein